MKKKMGRPLLSNTPKTVLVGARISETEERQIEQKAKDSGMTKSQWVRYRLLELDEVLPSVAHRKPYHEFPVKCPEAAKYSGKTAVFQVEHRGKLHVLTGNFIVHTEPNATFIVLRSLGNGEVLGQDYFLSQQHADSITLPPDLEASGVYLIECPFLARHRKQTPKSHSASGG